MKVVERRKRRLVAVFVPWPTALVLAAATVGGAALLTVGVAQADPGPAIAGGFVLAAFGTGLLVAARRIELVLDRDAGTAVLWRRSLLGATQRTWPLETLERVEAERARDGRSVTHRPVLVFRDGTRVPVVALPYAGEGAVTAARYIADWLRLDSGAARP